MEGIFQVASGCKQTAISAGLAHLALFFERWVSLGIYVLVPMLYILPGSTRPALAQPIATA